MDHPTDQGTEEYLSQCIRLNDPRSVDNPNFQPEPPWTPLRASATYHSSDSIMSRSSGFGLHHPLMTNSASQHVRPQRPVIQSHSSRSFRPRTDSDSGYGTLEKSSPSKNGNDAMDIGQMGKDAHDVDAAQPGFYDFPELYQTRFPIPGETSELLDIETSENGPWPCHICNDDPKVQQKPDLKNRSDYK